jgi:hypothetical protein
MLTQGPILNRFLVDEDAEKCVLRALLEVPNARAELGVSCDLFYFPTSKIIFAAIEALCADGAPADIVVLTQYLDRMGLLEKVGGAVAITRLATEYPNSLAVAKYEVAVLRENYGKRKLAELAAQFTLQAQNGADLSQITRGIRKELSTIEKFGEECRKPLIEFKTPSQLRSFQPASDPVLIGESHVVKGAVFLIAGAPGVGKSRASIALAIAGATRQPWFGLEVHTKFKTMIVQNENGQFRLKDEFQDLDCKELDEFVRVCLPPPAGLCFDRSDFREAVIQQIKAFSPAVVIIDPWNQVARDEKASDYLETLNRIREVIPPGDNSPALGIVAHTRKPRTDERRVAGRGLLNTIAGSYVIGSVARTAFIMQSASDDPQDQDIVWSCCKNNDGNLGPRSAWRRRNGLFDGPLNDFDWEEFDSLDKVNRFAISAEDVAQIFDYGKTCLTRTEAWRALNERTGAGRTACYEALNLKGRFGKNLRECQGRVHWNPA